MREVIFGVVLAVCIVCGLALSALTMEEWIDQGGPKHDPFGNRCMDYCNNKVYECRERVKTRAKNSAEWAQGLAGCDQYYKDCANLCNKTTR